MAAFPLNRPSAPLGLRNAVLRARARTHSVRDFPGPLSIKSVTSGKVAWKVGARELVAAPGSFLVLNEGEPYSMQIDSRTPVATFCIFFQDGFVDAVRASMAQRDIEPDSSPGAFPVRLHLDDGRILARLESMASVADADPLWLDTHCLALARDLLLRDNDFRRRIRLLPARRAATRDELLRRIRRGQEFLHAHACEDPDLTNLARAACLSPYHFHRAFTHVFGQTPHEYRTRLRLAEAHRLIERTDLTITAICGATGFESSTSFSLLFRRYFGAPPSSLRRSHFARFDKTPAARAAILES